MTLDKNIGTFNPFKSVNLNIFAKSPLNIQKFFADNFRAGIKKQPTLLGHCLISASLIAVLGASYYSLNSYADKKANEWINNEKAISNDAFDKDKQVAITKKQTETLIKGLKAQENEKLRIAQQLETIEFQISRYSKIMVFFSNHYYTALIITSASTLVAATCLLFISKKGWEQAHNSIINVFIIASGAVIFLGDLPGTFKEKENFEAYGSLYIQHIALRNEILSYLATGGNILGADPKKPNEVSHIDINRFIYLVDNKLVQLNKIAIAFDATGINDITRTAGRIIPTSQPSAPSQ